VNDCLSLCLLGEPRIQVGEDQKPVTVASRKTVALLGILALSPNAAMSREELVALLWGDRFDQQGRQSLRQALYSLRKALGEICNDAISMDGEIIGLNRDMVSVDVWEFERLANQDDEASLSAAAALYRGRLLSGIQIRDSEFETWLSSERQRLKDVLWRTLYRIAKHQKQRKAYSAALDTTRRLLELNPLREKCHRLIMRIHAQSGDRAAALNQYRNCEEMLRRELDLVPDKTTLDLFRELRETAPELDDDDQPVQAAENPIETTVAPPPAAESATIDDGRYFARDRPAVAVLTFENLDGNSERDYFYQAITNDIATGLSYWRWFPVIGQNTTSALSGSGATPTEIARKVDARYLVTGTARRGRDSLRITAQLLDASTGHHLWASRFDLPLEDLFDVQDEITEKIVASIEPEVMRAEHSRAARKRPSDLTAWDLVVRADWCRADLTRSRLAEAIGYLKEAIEIDPDLSISWSQLAHCHWIMGIMGWSDDPTQSFRDSDEAARRALQLDESDWLAHNMLGLCDMWNRRDYDMSITRLKRAIELNPSASFAHHATACSLEFAGLPDEALPHIMTVQKLDPNYSYNASLLADLALAHLQLEKFEEAAAHARRSAATRPDYVRVYHRLAAALGHLGQAAEARKALDSIFRLHPGFSAEYVRSTYPFRDQRHLDILIDGLVKAGLGD
jgi:DNA-binding SARP family transcriptional activator/TolB-like protein